MLEQEGVTPSTAEYAVSSDANTMPPIQKSISYDHISRVSREIIENPLMSYSPPAILKAKRSHSYPLLESTLHPNILRDKIKPSGYEGPQTNGGQTLNFFKWISKKKKNHPSKQTEQSDYIESNLEKSSSNTTFDEVPSESNPEEITIQIPETLKEHILHIFSLLENLEPLFPKQVIENWSYFLILNCSKSKKNAESVLGKVIYLLDTHPKEFCSQLIKLEPKNHLNWVRQTFSERMNLIKKQVSQLCQSHEITGIQPSELVYQTKLPFVIAQTLISSEGRINYALCRTIAKHLLPPANEKLPFHKDIFRVLNLFNKSSNLRNQLSAIDIPSSRYSLANQLIRVQMGVSYADSIYRRDAIVTAFTASLSHLRQGPVGSCFATHFAIVLLSSHIEQCLKDFHMLLGESKLSRTVNGVKKDFPFLLMMSSDSSSNKLTVTKDGYLKNSKGENYCLWESPGIAAACKAIKIDTPKEVITSILTQQLDSSSGSESVITINIQMLLSLLCDYQIKKHHILPSKKMKLYSLAHFAFESQTRNGLLSVWENSIAEMAEGKEGSMIIPPVLHAIQSPILSLISEEVIDKNLSRTVKEKINIELSHEIQKRIHLHYDPNIFNDSINSEHMSSEGGYVIYDTLNKTFPNLWKRIDTPEKFSPFIASVFNSITPQISEILTEAFPKEFNHQWILNILKKIDTPEFTYQSMVTYYPEYKQKKDLLNNWNKCKYTPWRTLSGNLADKVREVYMEDDGQIIKSTLKPNNANELLINILSEIRKMPPEEQLIYQENPNKKIPVFTPTHAFSLLFGHPSLQQVTHSKQSIAQWVKKHIYLPCHQAINQSVEKNCREKMISFAIKELVSSENKTEFREAVNLLPEGLNYPKFRNCLIKLLDIIDPSYSKREERIQHIDQELITSLPQEVIKELSSVAVHFADTNWYEGLHDIHLCITLSPSTGKFAIMQIQDNGENLRPVKQYWLINHNWEFISGHKEALPPNEN
jgi:hypothetical protein